MKIAGTAQSYCLRSGKAVYELWNSGYSLAVASPGTGTVSPVERVVGGNVNHGR